MMITLELDTVDLAQIAESGQCFRMAPLEDGRWLVPMGRWMATARQRDARRIELSADGEDGTFFGRGTQIFRCGHRLPDRHSRHRPVGCVSERGGRSRAGNPHSASTAF